MKFQLQLVPVTQVCLCISFSSKLPFLNFFFQQQPSRDAVLEGGALEVCSESSGDAPVPDANSQSSFDEIGIWHGCSPVGLLHIFGAHFGGLLLQPFCFVFIFFFLGINLRGEIGIQLDVSLWSQE